MQIRGGGGCRELWQGAQGGPNRSAMTLQIEAGDVIKIILQFCKENNLSRSFEAIQNECQTSLNTVDSGIDSFVSNVNNGRWDKVLSQVGNLQVPQKKLQDLYEHVVLEMTEAKELDVARTILRQTQVMSVLRKEDERRYLRLENLMGRVFVDASDLYPETTRDKRRSKIASDLAQEVSVIPPSRLMTIVGQALKWQRLQGALPDGAEIDLLRGVAVGKLDEEERCPTTLRSTIKFGKDCHVECASFSPDGLVLATGSVDGFLEIWDAATYKLKRDLSYQAQDKFMLHSCPILCVAFSRDGELICSGDQQGAIKVWRYRSGQCIRTIQGAHSEGVTTVRFSRCGGQVLSGSFDGVVRVHGLKSGRVLKEFRGHTSYVNHALYYADGARVLTASSDGTVAIWEAKTTEMAKRMSPPRRHAGDEATVLSVHPYPKNVDYFVVCNRSPSMYLMTQEGQVVRSFECEGEDAKDFVAACVSTRGEYVYGLAADGKLHAFQMETGRLEETVEVAEGEPIGLCHHPLQNVIATFSENPKVKIFGV